MNTTPENVLDETLLQAKVVRAQLLIKTNTLNIARQVFHIHKIKTRGTNHTEWRI